MRLVWAELAGTRKVSIVSGARPAAGERSRVTQRDSSLCEPVGRIQRDGRVIVCWQSQGWILPAPAGPDGAPRKYLPCERCGKLRDVPARVAATCCDACGTALGFDPTCNPGAVAAGRGEEPCER